MCRVLSVEHSIQHAARSKLFTVALFCIGMRCLWSPLYTLCINSSFSHHFSSKSVSLLFVGHKMTRWRVAVVVVPCRKKDVNNALGPAAVQEEPVGAEKALEVHLCLTAV